MKRYFFLILLTMLCVFPAQAFAESFETTSACVSLQKDIKMANAVIQKLDALLTRKDCDRKDFLSDLYDGTKILTEAGDILFKAAERYESDCKDILHNAKKSKELLKLYEVYVTPTNTAYQFFKRARDIAAEQGVQKDVDDLTQLMKEYQASIEKLVSKCKADMTAPADQEKCETFSIK